MKSILFVNGSGLGNIFFSLHKDLVLQRGGEHIDKRVKGEKEKKRFLIVTKKNVNK